MISFELVGSSGFLVIGGWWLVFGFWFLVFGGCGCGCGCVGSCRVGLPTMGELWLFFPMSLNDLKCAICERVRGS